MLIQPTPLGLCHCGCGQPAPVAKCADKRSGVKRGQAHRFIRGHRALKLPICQSMAPADAIGRLPVFDAGEVVAHALVSASDWARVSRLRWSLTHDGYATTSTCGRALTMHRLVFGLTRGDGREVDHVNRDRLDNRRENLRGSDPALQAQNRGSHRGSTSTHRGVSLIRATGRWQVAVTVGGTRKYLGVFDDEHEAGAVASAFRAAHMPYSEDAAHAAMGIC